MPRFLSTLLVVALLGGTAAAFAVTQGLKTRPSPITAPRIQKVFSPQCDCATRVAVIQFRLRKPDRVRLQIVDGSGDVVRTLVPGRRLRRGTVTYTWNGRDDQGRFVAEGVYKPRVHLTDRHRTIDLPNDMQVDTTAPKISVVSVAPRTISPNGDGRDDRVRIAYRISEPAHAILLVDDGERQVFTRSSQPSGQMTWYGKVGRGPARAGPHRLTVVAQDLAGNVGPPRSVPVLVRYVELSRDTIEAKAGTRFGVRVSADRRIRWRLGPRNGTAAPGVMILRAPARPGRYRLVVSVPGHEDSATVRVTRR